MTVRIQREALRRWASFTLSLALHAALVNALWWKPFLFLPSSENSARAKSRTELDEIARFGRVIWLPKRQSLPRISPAPSPTESAPAEPRTASLYIRTQPPQPRFTDQFIQVPEPTAVEQAPLPSPNVVLGGTPLPPPPKRPEPRRFVPPPEAPKPARTLELDAPDPSLTAGASGLPVAPAPSADPRLAIPTGSLDKVPRSPARKMTAPAIGGERTASVGTLDAPAIPTAAGQPGVPGEISAIILSANPVPQGKLAQPAGNRPAQINAGSPSGQGQGQPGDVAGGGIFLPGVTVRDPGASASASGTSRAPAPAAPAAAVPTRPLHRPRLDTPSVSIAQWPSNRRVPAEVEASFPGRPVYSTVLPGAAGAPDINLWFGESQPPPMGTRVIMRPPRLDSAGIPANGTPRPATGKYWLKAKLSTQGALTALEVLRGAEGAPLAKMLESWLWTPAIRNGAPVEVDVVLEVEVRAAP